MPDDKENVKLDKELDETLDIEEKVEIVEEEAEIIDEEEQEDILKNSESNQTNDSGTD